MNSIHFNVDRVQIFAVVDVFGAEVIALASPSSDKFFFCDIALLLILWSNDIS